MEAMDADCYVIEYAIRDRLIEARARARTAALLRQATDLRRSKRAEGRLTAFGRALGNRARNVATEVSRAIRGRARITKRSPLALSARRGS